jgi:hypothetical protein
MLDQGLSGALKAASRAPMELSWPGFREIVAAPQQ